MSLPRGRVLRGEDATWRCVPVSAVQGRTELPVGRLLKRIEMEAAGRARETLDGARRTAEALLEDGERRAAERRLAAEAEARAVALADFAAHSIALVRREMESDEEQGDRIVMMARLLAERLLGEELRLDARRIVPLLRQVMQEVRGARRAVVEAHPLDARALREHLCEADACGDWEIRENGAFARGDIRVTTEHGVVDARLGSRLEQLAVCLREGLSS